MNVNDHQAIQAIQDAVDGACSVKAAWDKIKQLGREADEALTANERREYEAAMAPPKIGGNGNYVFENRKE